MPRLEIETIEDMRVLFDIGALTPDMSLQLSQILLGEDIDNKRRRQHILGGRAGGDAGQLQAGDLEALKRGPGGPKAVGDRGGADGKAGGNGAGDRAKAGGKAGVGEKGGAGGKGGAGRPQGRA